MEPIVIVLALKTKHPVKLLFTREEVFFHGSKVPMVIYIKDGVKYIITSDFIRMRYYSFPKKYSNEIRFYESLDEFGREIYSVSPAKRAVPFRFDEVYSPFWNLFVLDRPGPQIRVYQLF